MFRIMFYQPCIPPNTGNAIRLAANTGCELHLIEPLGGFSMSDAQVKRAGLDYHEMATVTVHPNLVTAWTTLKPERVFAFTAHAERYHTDVDYRPGDVLLFGPEPTGLPDESLPNPRSPTACVSRCSPAVDRTTSPTRRASSSTRRGGRTVSPGPSNPLGTVWCGRSPPRR